MFRCPQPTWPNWGSNLAHNAYGKLKIKCTKSGVAKITVTAIGGGDKVGTGTVMGGMTITKEFAIIARGVQAGNGGWL